MKNNSKEALYVIIEMNVIMFPFRWGLSCSDQSISQSIKYIISWY